MVLLFKRSTTSSAEVWSNVCNSEKAAQGLTEDVC